MKNLFVLLIVVAALGFGGFQGWKKWKEKQVQAQLARQPKTAPVESRDIRFAISAAGDIGPADQVSVRPEVNGKISELPVDIGDQVIKGDLLFALDDQDLQIEREQRTTEIEGAKLQLERAERNFIRTQQLFSQNLMAREAFDNAKTDFELAKNSLEKSQKALALVEDRISKTRIVAPFDCTVLTRPVSIGQAVSGSGGFNSGTEVMTIANLKNMIIMSHVSQADVTRLKPGQAVDVEVESVAGVKMKGVVERIAPQATVKSNLKGFSARIAIQNIDERVRPGMTANLRIPIDSATGVLAVPLGAIFTEQGERFVYVKNGQGFERRKVSLGISDYRFAEITTGLSSGDIIALEQPPDAPAPAQGRRMRQGGGSPRANSAPATTSAPRHSAL
ncbi:MAG: efflux RND transporter periplasmic adaptor subunit [Limisphaerales bacterium]